MDDTIKQKAFYFLSKELFCCNNYCKVLHILDQEVKG